MRRKRSTNGHLYTSESTGYIFEGSANYTGTSHRRNLIALGNRSRHSSLSPLEIKPIVEETCGGHGCHPLSCREGPSRYIPKRANFPSRRITKVMAGINNAVAAVNRQIQLKRIFSLHMWKNDKSAEPVCQIVPLW